MCTHTVIIRFEAIISKFNKPLLCKYFVGVYYYTLKFYLVCLYPLNPYYF